MREMLRESHTVLGQLCALLEQERSKREQCAQGVKQQRVRTELLMQLLQHFKNRTQDLAPQALLGQQPVLGQTLPQAPSFNGFAELPSNGYTGVGTHDADALFNGFPGPDASVYAAV